MQLGVAGNPVCHTATATLMYGDNSVLNPERLSAQFCQNRLKKVTDVLWPSGYENSQKQKNREVS